MTSFYASESLAEVETKSPYGVPGIFKPLELEKIKSALKKNFSRYYSYYFGNKEEENQLNLNTSKVTFQFDQNRTMVTICLEVQSSTNPKYKLILATCTLQTVNANCGSLIISNLYSEFRGSKFGTFLFDQVLEYCKYSGYSYLLLNTAGNNQNPLGVKYFHNKYGFKPFRKVYINKRSGNVNIWYHKFLDDVKTMPLSEGITFNGEDEEYDEDNE